MSARLQFLFEDVSASLYSGSQPQRLVIEARLASLQHLIHSQGNWSGQANFSLLLQKREISVRVGGECMKRWLIVDTHPSLAASRITRANDWRSRFVATGSLPAMTLATLDHDERHSRGLGGGRGYLEGDTKTSNRSPVISVTKWITLTRNRILRDLVTSPSFSSSVSKPRSTKGARIAVYTHKERGSNMCDPRQR